MKNKQNLNAILTAHQKQAYTANYSYYKNICSKATTKRLALRYALMHPHAGGLVGIVVNY